MSERYCKFQVHPLNTVGRAVETRTVLQSVADGQMDVYTDKGKAICPSPPRGRGIKRMDCKV